MRAVLQPLNERASELIMSHADLLDSPDLWTLMLQLVAHSSALKVLLDQWEQGDYSCFSVITYPDGLMQIASREYRRAKSLQAELLGLQQPRRLSEAQEAEGAAATPKISIERKEASRPVALNNRRPQAGVASSAAAGGSVDGPRARL